MNFLPGQIVEVSLSNGWIAHGRVRSIQPNGDGHATFKMGEKALVKEIVPEMVTRAFWHEGKGRYGV